MERVTQEKLYNQFLCPDLGGKTAQSDLVLVCGYTDGELFAKLLGQSRFEAKRRLIVDLTVAFREAQRAEKLILGELRHPDQESATMSFTARPGFDIGTDLFPSPKIEIADAEIGAGR